MMRNTKFLDEEECRCLSKMAYQIKDEDKRFHFVHTHISIVEECMPDGEGKGKLVKAMSSWALKEFNAIDKFKSDKRMLDLWKLLGKYSEDMKMEGVLENVFRLGFFNIQPEFYLLWAEHWASLGHRRNFDHTIRLCQTNCGISSAESAELFRSLTAKYFEGPEAATGGNCGDNTMALIRMIAARPEDVRRDLTVFNRGGSTIENAQQTHHHQQQQQQCPSTLEKQKQFEQPKQQEQHQQSALFMANSQQQHQQSALFVANNREEFSVFRDNTTMMQQQQQPKQVEEKSKMLSAKKQHFLQPKPSIEIVPTTATTTSTSSVTQKPLNNNSNKKRNEAEEEAKKLDDQMAAKGPRESMFGDITVSGAHGKFAPTMCTSTPRRSVLLPTKFDPMLDMMVGTDGLLGGPIPQEVEANAMEEDKDGGLFTAPAVAELGAGSRLQRRLSLAMPHLQQLKIGPTVVEEKKKQGTDVDGKENCSFASPDRKKKRQEAMQKPCPSPLVARNVGGVHAQPAAATKPQQQPAPLGDVQQRQLEDKDDEQQLAFDPDSTHLGTVVEKIKPDTVNPWNEQKRQQVLESAPIMVECHEFLNEKCPRIEPKRTINLGGEGFQVDKLLGQGGFARVYKVKSLENNRTYAIKYEAPPCPWEVYICSTLKRRCPAEFVAYMMDVRDAFIFTNASAIIYDFYPCGTLLDLSNLYKKNGAELGGLLVTFFAIQLARTLQQVHDKANIIHADVKPDNVVLLSPLFNDRLSLAQLLDVPMLKLIDWGRSIDMEQFRGVEFMGRAGTEHFDCTEMIMNMPWTFQTDFYGFCASVYVLMKGEYLVTFRYGAGPGKIVPVKPLKRRMAMYDMWTKLFEQFLNIPSCAQLPQWSDAVRLMEERLADAVRAEPLEWKRALERFNQLMKSGGQSAAC